MIRFKSSLKKIIAGLIFGLRYVPVAPVLSRRRGMFYLYPTTSDDIFGAFERCKENSSAPLSAQSGRFYNHSIHKHGDDLRFYDDIQTSQYRTYDPEQATLYVIPVLISFMLRYIVTVLVNFDVNVCFCHNRKTSAGILSLLYRRC